MIKTETITRISEIKAALKTTPIKSVEQMNSIDMSNLPSGSISISAVQKALIAIKHKALDTSSEASRFFGVDSAKNILSKIENQLNLIMLKCNEHKILTVFPKRASFNIDRESTMEHSCKRIWDTKGGQFYKLHHMPARLTFGGKFFGENGEDGLHTIGLIFIPKTKTLLCLDSLSNIVKEVKDYQNILSEKIFKSPNGEIKKIIFSNKPQQGIDDYTCNNWTIANIESVQEALKEGVNIDCVKTLNSLLRDDINTILKEQHEYVIKNS